MGSDDGAARYRVIMEATRRALREDIHRARTQMLAGALMILTGSAVAVVLVSVMLLGAPSVLIWGSFAITPVPYGIARLTRGARTAAASRRRLRHIDEQTALPVARVLAR
ncbi:MAG TPA: hypothetical protein VNO30_16130 [Kofleriaceae bacterium]|nr:hypothetical protein [Kofleriaceae bacterium]